MDATSEATLLAKFNTFLHNSDFSSTYKPVFLKSIMDLSEFGESNSSVGNQWLKKDNDNLIVELDFVAVRYAKYYWDMYNKFKLRQSHNPEDVNIHKIFKMSKHPEKPPTIKELASDDYSDTRKLVISRSIRPEVLRRINKDMELYKIVSRKNYIIFEYSIVPFLKKFKSILVPAINYVLTRYLEKINFSPRIAEKVLGKIPRDYLTKDEREILMRFHHSCFYCNKNAENYHIDHVIPFDYVFHTDIFNTVPACIECNSKKSNRLPKKEIFGDVLKRNKRLSDLKDYTPEWYQNLYDKCIIEYHGSRDFFSP